VAKNENYTMQFSKVSNNIQTLSNIASLVESEINDGDNETVRIEYVQDDALVLAPKK